MSSSPRITRIATAVSTLPQHLAKRTPLAFGDDPEIRALLAKPSWSVKSLLPEELRRRDSEGRGSVGGRLGPAALGAAGLGISGVGTEEQKDNGGVTVGEKEKVQEAGSKEGYGGEKEENTITPEKLRHLLRLSALPEPASPLEEAKMLRDLRSQIHFVKQIQRVDTTGVEPLVAIRDETSGGVAQSTITMETLKPWLDDEEVIQRGGFRRIRRRRGESAESRNTALVGTGVKIENRHRFDVWPGKVEGYESRVDRELRQEGLAVPWADESEDVDVWEKGMGVGFEKGSGRRQGRYFVVKKGRKKDSGKEVGARTKVVDEPT